jgi:AcrR family transcriptional regulator
VREWVPVPSSVKGRLVHAAVDAFAANGFAAVGVSDLAAKAGVTTGSLYHHFGSKLGLYTVVRDDVERRVIDRMAGAAAARDDEPVRAALLVAFDYAAEQGFSAMLAENHPERPVGPIERFLSELVDPGTPLAKLLTAAWQAALEAVADGTPVRRARDALERLL